MMFSAFAHELTQIALEKRAAHRPFFEASGEKDKRRADYHFSPMSGEDRWGKFIRNVESPGFVGAIARHKKSDPKLVTHAQSMHELVTGSTVGKVQSANKSGKTYEIKKVPGGLGCTCPDWRFVSSVKPKHECKHIRAYRAGNTKAD
jgi:hypothetical protein